jgi:hypothetical protein
MPDQSDPPVRLRLPTLEVFSALNGGAFAGPGTPLTDDERNDAFRIFQDSINLDVVRIVPTRVVAAPTTLGNNIRVPPDYALSRQTLIHELTHVWQYQTKGTGYISNSICEQLGAIISTGDRNAAYQLTIVAGQSIHRYSAEQQAVIVESYYADPKLANNPEFQRMMREVRVVRPIPTSLILEEAAYGSDANWKRWQESTGTTPNPFLNGSGTPLFRVEF